MEMSEIMLICLKCSIVFDCSAPPAGVGLECSLGQIKIHNSSEFLPRPLFIRPINQQHASLVYLFFWRQAAQICDEINSQGLASCSRRHFEDFSPFNHRIFSVCCYRAHIFITVKPMGRCV
ncbi:hypothetical protein NQD34_002919 [Periophthalmus magnuspinnatus]|nr:hypothetical protein NQD34_002919 [Periophthalmus magnuspinnatus]